MHALIRRHAALVLAVAAAATAGFALALPALDVSNPASKYELPSDDPVAVDLARFQALFGAREPLAVAFDYGRAVTAADISALRRLAPELRRLPGVARVLVPADPRDRVLVGRDGESALAMLELEPAPEGAGSEVAHGPLLEELTLLLDGHAGDFRAYHLAGLPLIDRAFEEHLRRDLGTFSLLGIGIALVLLLVLYRDPRAVLVSGGVAVASVVWSLGILSLAGTPLSVGVAMMIPLILMLSVAYSAHYLSHWLASSGDRSEALAGMLDAVLAPSIITGLATAAGFFALTASAIEGLRDVGVHFGLGALAAALLNATVVPAALYRWVPPGRVGGASAGALPASVSAWLRRTVLGRAGAVLAAAAALAVLSLVGLGSLRVDSNHLAYFGPETPLRTDYAFVDERFGGVIPLEILVRTRADDLGVDLERMTRLTTDVRGVEGVGRVVAPHELVGGIAGAVPAVWRSMAAVEGPSRYIRALEDDGFLFRISAAGYIQGSEGLSRVVDEVGALSEEAFGDRATLTGLMPVFVRTMDHLVRSQVTSFAIALTVVAVMFLLLAGSPRRGASAVVANLLPILLVLGGMGWLGIPVDFGTAMIASVLIGIAVHDTVHVLFRLRRERAAGAPAEAALATTFHAVGPPVVASTLVFCSGLLVLVFSDFAPVRHFGLLSCAAMAAALLADLLLLPALVAVAEPSA